MLTETRHGLVITPVSDLLDEVSGRRLRTAARDAAEQGELVQAVDLRPLAHIDSPTLAALIRVLRAVREIGGSIGLIVEQPNILRVLSITGLDRIFPVYRNETDAQADAHASWTIPA